jgi:hypothetical protein
MIKLNNEVAELAIEELDAVTGAAKADIWEFKCPVGHVTLVKLTQDDGQVAWGAKYHL